MTGEFQSPPAYSGTWHPDAIEEIQEKAELGRYQIRGQATKRQNLPTFDDLVFTPAGLSRMPLEGYRERCDTKVIIGEGRVSRPLVLERPIMIAGMSFGALSVNAKRALGIAATRCGISTCTGEGGMHPEEREHSSKLVMQYLPSRYGMNPYDLKKADMIEIGAGQGAKPGTGGVLLGLKMSEEVAKMRDLPVGIDQRSGCRHPDWMGADDLYMKLEQIRRSQSRSGQRASPTMSAWPAKLTSTPSYSMAWKAAPPPHRQSSSTMPAFRQLPPSQKQLRRCMTWANRTK